MGGILAAPAACGTSTSGQTDTGDRRIRAACMLIAARRSHSAVPDCMHGLCTAADTTCAIEDRATQLALYGPRPNCLREALMHGFAVAFAQAELHLGMTMIVAALFMLAVLRLALSGTVLV